MNKQELIEIIVCPKCRGRLSHVEQGASEGFVCASCALVYPIQNDIPIMLIDHAIPAAEWPREAGAE